MSTKPDSDSHQFPAASEGSADGPCSILSPSPSGVEIETFQSPADERIARLLLRIRKLKSSHNDQWFHMIRLAQEEIKLLESNDTAQATPTEK